MGYGGTDLFFEGIFVDKRLLEILVCPVTKGPLIYQSASQELISLSARLAYPIRDDIPIMLETDARTLDDEEYETLRKAHPAEPVTP
jgi:uncharacterized protein